jgi:NADPH-dependent glutamate synthase beta subunit-like oxidoreductase
MPKLTIDDLQAEVQPGATILDAAEQLGIDIPTLCFVKGYDPSTSCQVCLVRNRATGQLHPACATRVVDGMEIASETPDVHELRRTALELLLSDHVGDCFAPCFFACPAHMDIPLMLEQIGDENLQEAIATVKRDIALPAVLGRICPKPCEKGCRRKGADGPVAVCELKRYVADADLEADSPYLPESKPPTGKRVAIVGAGASGLAAAYYLQQEGHTCVLFDDQPQAGGRIRQETSEKELPRDVLDREIRQILRLGIEFRPQCRIADNQKFQALCEEHDAVLVACGATAVEQAGGWGLKTTRRGVEVNKDTFETARPGVFAAGCAVRGKAMVVRSAADGKEVAACIAQFLQGQPLRNPGKPFSSRIGRVDGDEMERFLEGAGDAKRETPPANDEFTSDAAAGQSHRCLACGCVAQGNCRLEHYAQMYSADTSRFGGQRRPYEVIGRSGSVVFEPGKCIKCELCVQIASKAGEPLGLTFVGRGFDVRLAVPFQGDMEDAMTKVAEECVAACPTGAIYFTDGRTIPGQTCAGSCGRENGGCQ